MSNNPEADKIAECAAFDVLRFMLASAVALSHIGILTWNQSGLLAVQVFFALSGWLIGGILYGTSSAELGRFYFNRSTRVWIPYFFTVVALYCTSLIHEPVRSSRWLEFLAYDATFTHNWFTLRPDAQLALAQMPLRGSGNHFWSLAVEEQFYLVAPLIMTLLPFGRKMLPWVAIAAVAYLSGSQYAAISFGVLAAVINQKSKSWNQTGSGTVGLIVALGGSIGFMAVPAFFVYAAPVFSICVVLLCARPGRRGAITRWMGGVSFPLYLNAWIGIFALHAMAKHLGMTTSWYTPYLEFLASLGAGAITYSLIDRPVLRYRSRYFNSTLGFAIGAFGYLLVSAGIVYGLSITRP
jgi:peptidoglycan/LPS O-acetylase OafA/YrhL